MENYIFLLLLIVQIGPLTLQRFEQICGMFFLVFKSPQIRFGFIEYSLETTLRVHRSIAVKQTLSHESLAFISVKNQ